MTDSRRDPPQLPQVELYTDGACLGNPGPGGWAYILKYPDGTVIDAADGEARTTNNRMELMGVIRALESLDRPHRVHLCADSEYVVKGIGEWLAGWKRRGWRKADKKPVMNGDLWQTIDRLIGVHDVRVEWTRGHAGHPENEAADRMAADQAEQYRDGK